MDIMVLYSVLTFFIGYVIGIWHTNRYKNAKELADPTVHVIERRIYWVSNVHHAYNALKQIFDDNPDKFECLKLTYQDECYNHNKFYCRYRSINNKYIIKLTLGFEDTPIFTIEENK